MLEGNGGRGLPTNRGVLEGREEDAADESVETVCRSPRLADRWHYAIKSGHVKLHLL